MGKNPTGSFDRLLDRADKDRVNSGLSSSVPTSILQVKIEKGQRFEWSRRWTMFGTTVVLTLAILRIVLPIVLLLIVGTLISRHQHTRHIH
jgi:hypothetical protein